MRTTWKLCCHLATLQNPGQIYTCRYSKHTYHGNKNNKFELGTLTKNLHLRPLLGTLFATFTRHFQPIWKPYTWNWYLEHLGTIGVWKCAGNYFVWLGNPYMQKTTGSDRFCALVDKLQRLQKGSGQSFARPPKSDCLSFVFWFLP